MTESAMRQWQPHTFAQALAAAAAGQRDQEVMVVGETRLTYGRFWDDVRTTAANLKRLGLRRGDHFAICLGNSTEWATLLFAAATIGAVTVPVNTRFKADELLYCLKQADVRMLAIADRFLKIDFIAMLRSICPALDGQLPDPALPLLRTVLVFGKDIPTGALPADELRQAVPQSPDGNSEAVTPDDIVLIQYTSGTTSFPKGVMLTHLNMLRDAFHVGERLNMRAGDRYFSARPLFHVAGTTLSLLVAVEASACYLTTPNFDAGEALRLLEEERCTHTCGNDTMFLMMMAHPSFPSRRLTLRGGWAAASRSVMQSIHDKMGMRGLCSAFGLSESSPNAAMSPHDDLLEKRLSGLAKPLPGVEIRIADPDTGAERPTGLPGEIQIRGWNVMKGYYNMPEQTAKTIDSEGWLHTGDVGVADEDGRIAFAGRLKEMLRVGGENVSPVEIEDMMHRHPAIKQSQVIGVPDPRLMEVVAAYVILKDGSVGIEPDEIIAWCKERMANFKVPRYVRIIDTFDHIGMTASSKVQKSKLREYALDDLKLRSGTT
jgi:fatty-acyl-CoA synthase